jgi:hypothetical protein
MSIKKKVVKSCLLNLGCQPEPDRWQETWDNLKQLAEVFGERRVHEAFEEWAETRKGDQIQKPVSEFLKVAPGICTGVIQLKPKGDLYALLNELAAISDNRVLFNREQQAAVGRLMAEHSPADIKSAFQEFWGNIENDDFSVRQAAKTFTEAAEQLLAVQARRREKEVRTQELLRASTEAEQKKAAEELAARMKEESDLADLVEDTLGDGL